MPIPATKRQNSRCDRYSFLGLNSRSSISSLNYLRKYWHPAVHLKVHFSALNGLHAESPDPPRRSCNARLLDPAARCLDVLAACQCLRICSDHSITSNPMIVGWHQPQQAATDAIAAKAPAETSGFSFRAGGHAYMEIA